MRAVITAGGTSEPIDDVRVVTNLSTGRFGAAIASALAERGVEVELLAGRALASHPEWVDARVRQTPFGSVADLAAALERSTADPPDLLFMAAAVSDYSPVRSDGKIRSDAEELQLVLRRVPKLLPTLRGRCGPRTFLVGFKLLSGVPRERLVEAARRQVETCRLDLCVANDLRELAGALHPVVLVPREGPTSELTGTKAEVARALVDRALAEAGRSRGGDPGTGVPPRAEAEALASLVAGFATSESSRAGVSRRDGEGLWTTPVPAEGGESLERREAAAVAALPPSPAPGPAPEARVHALAYRAAPRVEALLELPGAMVVGAAEAPASAGLAGALLRASGGRRWDGGAFSLLAGGVGLVGIRSVEDLQRSWERVVSGFRACALDLGLDPDAWSLAPIWDRGTPVGALARSADPAVDAWGPWLLPDRRGAGRGGKVVERLAASGTQVWALEADPWSSGFAERGWRLEARQGPLVRFRPPTAREDLLPAASVCLLDPVSRRVLIGRRKTRPFLDHWAFPGGKLLPGENALDGGLRELSEETGVRPPWFEVVGTWEVCVGDRPGYRLTHFQLAVPLAPEPVETDELQARWVPLEQALHLRPMAAGTRAVLRRLPVLG